MARALGAPRRAADAALVALFVAAISAPLLDWCGGLDHTPPLEEKRSLAPWPAWPATAADAATLPKQLDAYWNDNFGFRRLLIRLDAMAGYEFGVSTTNLVVVGRHDWLFYTGDRSMDSHRGLIPFNDDELARWKAALEARRDWLARQGIRYLFVVCPDKETIYPEMLPPAYDFVGPTPLDQLLAYLKAHSTVDVLDLRPVLLAAKKDGLVYHRTDTHWTDFGALSGYRAILGVLRGWFPQIEPREPASFTPRRAGVWSGDLAVMLGIKEFVAEPLIELAPPPLRSIEVDAGGYRPPHSARYEQFRTDDAHRPRAVFFHDSFFVPPEQRGDPAKPPRTDPLVPRHSSLSLTRLIAEQFSASAFTWQHEFVTALVDREHPDVVVQEEVERMLRAGPDGPDPRP